MKNLFVIALLLCALSARAQTQWKYIGAEVENNGWVLKLTLSTSPNLSTTAAVTNLAFFNGLGTNNSLTSTTAMTLSVTSPGFDDVGQSNNIGRSIFGTRLLRLAYPMQNTNDVIAQNVTNVVCRIALSEYVYSQDTVTISALAGAVASTNLSAFTNSAAFTAQTVTNSSTQGYQKVIANWSWPGYQLITNSSFQVRAVAFHRDGRQGRPIRVMRFVASSNNGTPSTNWVTSPTVDLSMGDAVPVVEYVGNLDCSSFTNGSLIRCDFTAYPWIGTTNFAVTDTFDNAHFTPAGDWASITNVCDRLGTYGASYAVVSGTNNSGSAGVVSQTFNAASPPLAFGTIAQAQIAICASNVLWYGGRNDAGAAWIYCRGSNNWTGAGTPAGSIPNTWLNIAGYPGDPITGSWILRQSDNNILKGREKFSGIYLSNTAAIVVYSATASHSTWVDQCRIWMSGANALDTRAFYVTRSTVDQFTQGFRGPAGDNAIPALIRGNTLSNAANNQAYCMLGNLRLTNAVSQSDYFSRVALLGQVARSPKLPILAFNKVMGQMDFLHFFDTAGDLSNKLGMAIVQNVFEYSGNISYAASVMENDFKPATNFVIWENTTVGQRWNYAYNSTGNSNPVFHAFSLKNNHFTAIACKSDTFTTGDNARTGNWAVVNSVGSWGNTITGTTNISTVAFPFEFQGIDCYEPPTVGNLNRVGFYRFNDHRAYDGATIGSGAGNYRVLSDSPGFKVQHDWLIPFDLEGFPRGRIDPPGAYSSGNVKKGAFF